MNWNKIETGWTSYTANAKQPSSTPSDEQLTDAPGKREQPSAQVPEADKQQPSPEVK